MWGSGAGDLVIIPLKSTFPFPSFCPRPPHLRPSQIPALLSPLQGRMSGYHPSDGRHRIRFDDASSRLLNMRGKPFSWVSPRSRAAGYSRPLHEALARMGADNVPPVGPCNPGPALTLAAAASSHPSAPLMLPLAPVAAAASASVSEQSGDAATGGVAVPPLGFSATVPSAVLPGQRVCLFWPGDGLWYPGEVLRYDEDQVRGHEGRVGVGGTRAELLGHTTVNR